MKVSIVGCLFVLDSMPSDNIKKNDIKTIKVLIDKNENRLLNVLFDEKTDIKEQIKNKISDVIGSDKFHLEQVYTLAESKFYEDSTIDVIYMGLTNMENVKELSNDYKLVNLQIEDNETITLDDKIYNYETKLKKSNNNIEYYHEIDTKDLKTEKLLVEVLTTYKHLRSRIDTTDACFKLLPSLFTLEDVRNVYELIKGVTVDKSNFRKKIAKYVLEQDMIVTNKGYRPTKMYKFNPLENDIWL